MQHVDGVPCGEVRWCRRRGRRVLARRGSASSGLHSERPHSRGKVRLGSARAVAALWGAAGRRGYCRRSRCADCRRGWRPPEIARLYEAAARRRCGPSSRRSCVLLGGALGPRRALCGVARSSHGISSALAVTGAAPARTTSTPKARAHSARVPRPRRRWLRCANVSLRPEGSWSTKPGSSTRTRRCG